MWFHRHDFASTRLHALLLRDGWSKDRRTDATKLCEQLAVYGYEVSPYIEEVLGNLQGIVLKGEPWQSVPYYRNAISFGVTLHGHELFCKGDPANPLAGRRSRGLDRYGGGSGVREGNDATLLQEVLGEPCCLVGYQYLMNKNEISWNGNVYLMSHATQSSRLGQECEHTFLRDEAVFLSQHVWEDLKVADDLVSFLECQLITAPSDARMSLFILDQESINLRMRELGLVL